MLIKLTGGKVYDPAHRIDGRVMDLYIRDGRIVERPYDGEKINQEYDLRGKVVMAGAIDMHTHSRRRQGQHRPHDVAGRPPRRPGRAYRTLPCRLRHMLRLRR